MLGIGEFLAHLKFHHGSIQNIDPQTGQYYYYDINGFRIHIPNSTGFNPNQPPEDRAIYRINGQGFRGPEIPKSFLSDRFRVIFLGDSITFGENTDEDKIFVRIIAQDLNENHATKFELINTAHADIGLEQVYDIAKKTIPKFKPDLLVYCWYLNDSRPAYGFPEERTYKNKLSRWINHNPGIKSSYLINWIHYQIRDFVEKRNIPYLNSKDNRNQWYPFYINGKHWKVIPEDFIKLVNLAEFDWGNAWQEESLKKSFKKIAALNQLAQKNSVPFLIVAFPAKPQFEAEFPSSTVSYPQDELRKYLREIKVPFLDLLPTLAANKEKGVTFDHCHLTSIGHEIVAKEITAFLKKQPSFPKH